MTEAAEQLAAMTLQAREPGDVAAPQRLLTRVAGLDNPVAALFDNEQAHQLFEALDADFPSIRLARFSRSRIGESDQSSCTGLLRWLIGQLRAWRTADDARHAMIVAMFVVAQRCDVDKRLWPLLPDDIGNSADLIGYLQSLVASFAVNITQAGPNAPISEREIVERFLKAETEADWPTIIGCWQRFPPFFPNTLHIHAVQMLARYAMPRLVESVANLRQTIILMQLADILPREGRLSLALGSDNPRVQLAGAYRTLSGSPHRQRPNELRQSEQHQLADLLLKIAAQPSLWDAWMKVFNTDPGHFPALQAPLAAALVAAPDAAIESYVASIRLLQLEPNRQAAAVCLRHFHAKALPERRAILWTRAYERWHSWAFNKADPNHHLVSIARCELDYAIVAYASECMNDAGRTGALNGIRAHIRALHHLWHGSYGDLLANWNRLLSEFQPYAHAQAAGATGEDWLCEGQKTYWPLDQAQERYLMMKYRLSEHIIL